MYTIRSKSNCTPEAYEIADKTLEDLQRYMLSNELHINVLYTRYPIVARRVRRASKGILHTNKCQEMNICILGLILLMKKGNFQQSYVVFNNKIRRVLYLHRKHTPQIARIAATSLKLHESRSNLLQSILNQNVHVYQSLGILLKENNRLKNSTVLFFRKKYNSISSFCRCMQDIFARATHSA